MSLVLVDRLQYQGFIEVAEVSQVVFRFTARQGEFKIFRGAESSLDGSPEETIQIQGFSD